MRDRLIVVLAGNYQQYLDYVKDRYAPLTTYRYAANSESLCGINADEVIKVGTYYERKDWVELEKYAQSRVHRHA